MRERRKPMRKRLTPIEYRVRVILKAAWYSLIVSIATLCSMNLVAEVTHNTLLTLFALPIGLFLALVPFLSDEIERRKRV
jgi:hypothetical protein